jgi:pyrroline-5-carboxylate reductase
MKMREIGRIGIIGGGGWLGSALAKALISSGTVQPNGLTCSYRSGTADAAIRCHWTKDNNELVAQSDVVILSVRPSDWKAVKIAAADKLIVSVMAGVTLDQIHEDTGAHRVARALPNAAAELGFSYTPIYLQSDRAGDLEIARAIFESCGRVDIVEREDHIDYFTAMSGSGEAFPALLAEAMVSDAVSRGIPVEMANRAAQQVIIGAGRLQERHGQSPAAAVEAFVAYNGTTAAGILTMREKGFEAAVRSGLEAAYRKALALSQG